LPSKFVHLRSTRIETDNLPPKAERIWETSLDNRGLTRYVRFQKCESLTNESEQDQDPERPGFRCLQGLVNLLPNGPDDGGLIIAKGGHLLSEKYHRAMSFQERPWAWTNEMYSFTDEGLKWLEDQHVEWVKISCEPGDLIICACSES
jgi:hypothetical protein